MNREQAKQLLPIIQAFADGADVQFRSESGGWADMPPWAFPVFTDPSQYRIKPKPIDGWAVTDRDGDVRGTLFSQQSFAEKHAETLLGWGPFRVVHMREVDE